MIPSDSISILGSSPQCPAVSWFGWHSCRWRSFITVWTSLVLGHRRRGVSPSCHGQALGIQRRISGIQGWRDRLCLNLALSGIGGRIGVPNAESTRFTWRALHGERARCTCPWIYKVLDSSGHITGQCGRLLCIIVLASAIS